ncbi:MAG: threonine synthase, partial [Ectothiorhodospira sp.]
AASLAGALRDVKSGRIPEGSSIVCTLTGQGLKDPETAIRQGSRPPLTVEANLDSVKRAILDQLD